MTSSTARTAVQWGSDLIAEALRDTQIPFIALTRGASFRGLHNRLVNHWGIYGRRCCSACARNMP
jgi:hypothetical protein